MFEPRPTDYRGIKFKSKSEAIMARSLDLEPTILAWEYEPTPFKLDDGWIPDFWFIWKYKEPGVKSAFIEYKPSEPTNVYINELKIRYLKLDKKTPDLSNLLLIYGSPFDVHLKRSIIEYDKVEKGLQAREVVDFDFIIRKWDEAKQYRFDLINHN